ncbi:U-box domain-containing protein 14 [Glycine soja]
MLEPAPRHSRHLCIQDAAAAAYRITKPIHIVVEVIRTGSPRNRENVAVVLWSLCTRDPLQLKLTKEHGAEAALQELSENGTDRAKIKAGSILELLQRMEGYGGWRALEEGIRESQDSIWWRDLLSSQQQQQNQVVKTERNWKVEGGEKLYRISDQQKQIIMNMGNNTNGGWEWKLSWRTALFDSEIQMADNFLGELSQQQIQPNREDRCSWKHDQTGYYSTKSGYDLIWEAQMGANQNLDFVDIWKLKIPSKSLVFAWRLIRDKLPTRMNLRRGGACPFRNMETDFGTHFNQWSSNLKENTYHMNVNDIPLSQVEVTLKKSLQVQLWEAAYAYESMLRQKARIKWLKEGDNNSTYFHRLINHRRRKNVFSWMVCGFKINYSKSHFGCLGKSASWCREAAQFLNCRKQKVPVNILQYADDTVFVGEASWDNVFVMKAMLRGFEMVSGLKINFSKSSVGIFGADTNWVLDAAHFLKCRQMEIPFQWHRWWIALTSSIWKNRNLLIFQGKRFETPKVMEDALFLLWSWLNNQQTSSINSMGNFVEERWEWKLTWRRNFFDHEIDMVANFIADIESSNINHSNRDFLCWKSDPNGLYSTKSSYKVLQEGHASAIEDRVLNIMWSLKIPPRASAFSWRLFKNRLPTRDNLRRRQVSMHTYSCPLCDLEEESVNHLFFNCSKTRSLWWEPMRWVNRVGPFPTDPKNHFLQFSQWNRLSYTVKRWEFLWIALSVSIWHHRNGMIFNNQPFNPEKVMDEALFHTWS